MPGTDLPAIIVAALDAFAAGRRAVRALQHGEHLRTGSTNTSWRIRSDGVDWVVRASLGHDTALGVDRSRELDLHRRAAQAGYAPVIVHADPASGVLVTEFEASGSPAREVARQRDFCATVGERLAGLHALPVPAGIARFDVLDALAEYLERPPPADVPVPRPVVATALRRAVALYRPAGLALCHHDLHHGNLVLGPPLRFLDWEFAAFGDPWLDLAAYASYQDLDSPARTALLDGYGKATRTAPQAFEPLVTLFDCLRALWSDAAGAWPVLSAAQVNALAERLHAAGGKPATLQG